MSEIEKADKATFEVVLNESATRLTVHVYAAQSIDVLEFAAMLQDFVDDLKSGHIEVSVEPDDSLN